MTKNHKGLFLWVSRKFCRSLSVRKQGWWGSHHRSHRGLPRQGAQVDLDYLHWHKNASPWEEKIIVHSPLSRTNHTVPPNRKMAKKKGECKFWEISINYFHGIWIMFWLKHWVISLEYVQPETLLNKYTLLQYS